jgi:hypothetical protein
MEHTALGQAYCGQVQVERNTLEQPGAQGIRPASGPRA